MVQVASNQYFCKDRIYQGVFQSIDNLLRKPVQPFDVVGVVVKAKKLPSTFTCRPSPVCRHVNQEALAIYTIKDLEKLCGVKAHTIRMWERRYNLLTPNRTASNIRFYKDEDLKMLFNIALLNKNGIRISRIAEMSAEEIADRVTEISKVNLEMHSQIDTMTISLIEMDEFKFDKIIRTNIEQIGFEKTMYEVIYPFLEKLSLMWLTGSIHPVQEHFMNYLIRQKILAAIDQIPFPANDTSPRFLIYLPEGESQELSMLFMHYLLRARNFKVAYIGQNNRLGDLKDACTIFQPQYLFTMITETFSNEPVQDYIDKLCEAFPERQILLTGYQMAAQHVQSTEQVKVLRSLQETIDFLNEIQNQFSSHN